MIKSFIILILRKRARAIIKKFNPIVIAVTGSIGKTSTRNAIVIALSHDLDVRTAEKNYNNEIGVPLTILGMKSPRRSILKWFKLFWNSFFIKSVPGVFVLEYGADKPGDIAKLCKLAPPNIAIITGVSPVHALNFSNFDALIAEKASILSFLPSDGLAILNIDDKESIRMRSKTLSEVVTFGLDKGDYSAKDIEIDISPQEHFHPDTLYVATKANFTKNNSVIAGMHLKNSLGYAPIMSCLAALAVADRFDIKLINAVKELNQHISPEPGRLKPIAGIKGCLIIDDSYNAAPASMHNGLDILREFERGNQFDKKIVALGSMAELGRYSEDEHRLIGMKVAEIADTFIAVGEDMLSAVDSAKEAGMDSDKIEWFKTSEEAGRYLDNYVQKGDIIYVKGSQSARMEKVVKDIMAEPLLASKLIVRQDAKWLKN